MGCCTSSEPALLNNTANNNNIHDNSISVTIQREEQLSLAMRAKRGNVFTPSIAPEVRRTFVAKVLPKTQEQKQIILSAFRKNFAFEPLLDDLDVPLSVIVDAMTTEQVEQGKFIVTQGEVGDYFYIVERGEFTVLVDNKPVTRLGDGHASKSFGELSLIYDVRRQATVRADTNGSLFVLDRDTYRFTIANSLERKTLDISEALQNVPLLKKLTPSQMEKLVETVTLATFEEGSEIVVKGAIGSVFYIIKSGSVIVENVGDKNILLGPGEYFGERALMTNEPRAATVKAKSKTVCMALDKVAFQKHLGPLQDVLDQNINLRVLNSVRLFENLTTAERTKVCKSFVTEIYRAGNTIIKQGESGSKFYILLDGTAQVVDKDNTKINVLKSGDWFGEMALLDDDIRKATIVAISDCKCFYIDRLTFNKILQVGSLKNVIERETITRLETLERVSASHQEVASTSNQNYNNCVDNITATTPTFTNYLLKDLHFIAMLGTGTFGRVTLVEEVNTKKLYALKACYKSEIVAHKQQKNIINEKNVMISCNHPFILKLFQTFRDKKNLYMLLEFIQGGELFSVIHSRDRDGIPIDNAKFYGAGVLLALEHLHLRDIAYRDMKPENCLIDFIGYPKMVDFGFAKVITSKSFTLCGTPEYLAPELVLGRGHNKAVDYWAFGVLLYEMICGYSPFSDPSGNMDQVVICKNIVNGRLRFDRNFSSESQDLIRRLLTRDVRDRIGTLKDGTDDVKNHPWFSTVDFEKYTDRQIRAPWIPPIKSSIDTHLFEAAGEDDHVDNTSIDVGGDWDKDF